MQTTNPTHVPAPRSIASNVYWLRLGRFFFRYRNAMFPLACLLLFLPGSRLFPDIESAIWIGTAVALVGQLIRIGTIGLEYIVRGGKDRQVYAEGLVTEGIYAHCRNPMYIGNALIMLGVTLASNSWTCIGVAVLLFAVMYGSIVSAEEDFLRTKFGTAFDAYCERVPRWLPHWRALAATFTNATFHWRRVLVKEYGTPHGWIITLCLVYWLQLWRIGELHLNSPAVLVSLIILAVATALRFWVRTLKKRRVLIAD